MNVYLYAKVSLYNYAHTACSPLTEEVGHPWFKHIKPNSLQITKINSKGEFFPDREPLYYEF